MRLAILSDTHLPRGGRVLPEACRAELAAADLILHAGDLVRVPVLTEIETYGPVRAVLGNCDDHDLADLLPERLVVPVDGVRIGMVHDAGPATGRASRLRAWFPGCGVVVFGHSHVPLIEGDGALLLVNPGSACDRRAQPTRTMAVATITDGAIDVRLVDLGR